MNIEIKVALAWGKLLGENKQRGIIIPIADGLIAATAIAYHLTVVTENISDFVDIGARLFNPWLN